MRVKFFPCRKPTPAAMRRAASGNSAWYAAPLSFGRQHRHLQRQRGVPPVRKPDAQLACDAVIRMQARAVREQHRCACVIGLRVEREELDSIAGFQTHRVAHNETRQELVGPALLACGVGARLAERRACGERGGHAEDGDLGAEDAHA